MRAKSDTETAHSANLLYRFRQFSAEIRLLDCPMLIGERSIGPFHQSAGHPIGEHQQPIDKHNQQQDTQVFRLRPTTRSVILSSH